MNRRSVATVIFACKNPASAGSLRWLSVSSDVMKEVLFILQHYPCGNTVLSPTTCFAPLALIPHGIILHKTKGGWRVRNTSIFFCIACCALYVELVALSRKRSGIVITHMKLMQN